MTLYFFLIFFLLHDADMQYGATFATMMAVSKFQSGGRRFKQRNGQNLAIPNSQMQHQLSKTGSENNSEFVLPPFHKSMSALPKFTLAWSVSKFLRIGQHHTVGFGLIDSAWLYY